MLNFGKRLTISGHPSVKTFPVPALLAPVPVGTNDCALLVFGAFPVLDLLLDASPKEALKSWNY